jgi:tellurite methyltransferase
MSQINAKSPILDVRGNKAFELGHTKGAVNIPLEELLDRIHELPSPHEMVVVYDSDARRARWAVSRLRARGRLLAEAVWGAECLAEGDIVTGPSEGRMWSPHTLLQRALLSAEKVWGELKGRSALDIACGTGRDAVFMASRGLRVDAWDNLPDAIERCQDLASRNGVNVRVEVRDVVSAPAPDIALDSYDLLSCFNFLHRPLMPVIAAAVRPGGFVVYETFTREQRRLFGKPRNDSHLLESGELPGYFEGWQVIHYSESLVSPRRFVASLIVMKKKDERS